MTFSSSRIFAIFKKNGIGEMAAYKNHCCGPGSSHSCPQSSLTLGLRTCSSTGMDQNPFKLSFNHIEKEEASRVGTGHFLNLWKEAQTQFFKLWMFQLIENFSSTLIEWTSDMLLMKMQRVLLFFLYTCKICDRKHDKEYYAFIKFFILRGISFPLWFSGYFYNFHFGICCFIVSLIYN